ncbi:BNR/Asp-box repeat protein [Phycisphaerae bacterium RAS1]|nr:BNR/Asp-box repeat protein [Phycisphaerae bacterium RAS1]
MSRHSFACWTLALLLAMSRPAAGQSDSQAVGFVPHEAPSRHGHVRAVNPGRSRPPETLRVQPYKSVQVNVDANGDNIIDDAANEPSIAVDPVNPQRIVIGWRQFDSILSDFRQAGYAYSHDGGETWTFPGVIQPGVFRSDPCLGVSPDGSRFYYYSLTMDPLFRYWLFTSLDGGVTWGSAVDAYGGDKGWMVVDRTDGPGRGNIYAYSNADDYFVRSLDGGQSFDAPTPPPINTAPQWGTCTIGPDSSVYLFGTAPAETSPTFYSARSSNAWNAAEPPSFELRRTCDLGGRNRNLAAYPNPGGLSGMQWIVCDTSDGPYRGYLYAVSPIYSSGASPPDALDLHFIRSVDRGATWSQPRRINDDRPGDSAWQWFATMSISPGGRLDLAWCDTRGFSEDILHPSASRVYYAWSGDAGSTWSRGVPVSPVFRTPLGYPQGQLKMGDYVHMVSTEDAGHLAYAATFSGQHDVYYVRLGDCNNNGVHDGLDVARGASLDANGDGVPDECGHFMADLNCDGYVSALDVNAFTAAVLDPDGYAATYPGCDILLGDANSDGETNVLDINWFVGLLIGAADTPSKKCSPAALGRVLVGEFAYFARLRRVFQRAADTPS